MNKTIGLQLLVYSLLLAGLSYLTYYLAPTLARPTLITGLVGGAFCIVWGYRAIAGRQGRGLPLLTLGILNYIFLTQAVTAWGGGTQETQARSAAAIITLLLALSFAMMMRIAYASIAFDIRQNGPTKDRGAKSQ